MVFIPWFWLAVSNTVVYHSILQKKSPIGRFYKNRSNPVCRWSLGSAAPDRDGADCPREARCANHTAPWRSAAVHRRWFYFYTAWKTLLRLMVSSYLSNHFRCAEVCGETAYLACLRQMITTVQFDHLKSMPNKHWFPNTNFEFVLFIGRWKDDQIIAKEGIAVECAKTLIWSSQ